MSKRGRRIKEEGSEFKRIQGTEVKEIAAPNRKATKLSSTASHTLIIKIFEETTTSVLSAEKVLLYVCLVFHQIPRYNRMNGQHGYNFSLADNRTSKRKTTKEAEGREGVQT